MIYHPKCVKSTLKSIYTASKFLQKLVVPPPACINTNFIRLFRSKEGINSIFCSTFFVSSRMLNLILSKLRLIAKTRNTDGYKSMSKNQLINLIATGALPPTARLAF